MAVGSLLNDDSGSNQGKVRVYEYKSGSWSQIGSDILGGDANNDYFGGSLELSSDGKTIVISSDSHNGDGTDRGRVKVYQLLNDDSSWTQLGGNIDGIADNDYFGYSLSISSDANIIAVGADYVDNSGNTNIGAVYVKKYTSLGWVDHGSIILGETAGDTFGGSVSLSRDGNIRRRFK